MLRIHEITGSDAAKAYYRRSDYYLETPGEWLGDGARRLGLEGVADWEAFESLCDNVNPATGKGLTARTLDGRRVGWDFNFNSGKSVGIARELVGDADGRAIEEAHREAVAYAVGLIEADMQCRVRGGGQNANRTTGNLIAMRVTHRTTRPDESDHKPDMSLHDHVVIFNATHDDAEGKVKAAEIGRIKHDAPYYEAAYHNRLAGNLRELGYGVRRKGKGFELSGVSDELVTTFSRRTAGIEKRAAELGLEYAGDKARLGAMTRLNKIDSRLDELAGYWDCRLSNADRDQLGRLKGRPGYVSDARAAVAYALDHCFERQSVCDARRVYETAIRHGIGSVTPGAVEAEARRQGLLVRDGQATTRAVLEQESRIIAFGRAGRGGWRPLGVAGGSLDGLSGEQAAAVRHVWESPDRVTLLRGGAGTGKTRSMGTAVAGIGVPVVVLAPSAKASRGVLRDEGFAEADTVAAFLENPDMQEQARRGVIWVDEAGLLSTRQLDQVFAQAGRLGARVVLQGDTRQHAAVERSSTLDVLERFAGLPVAELTEIRRQTHQDFKQAVALIASGDVLGGYDRLDAMGWVEQTPAFDHNRPLVDAYAKAIRSRRPDGKPAEVLVVAPTHREGDEITAAIRQRLKEDGVIGRDEKTFATLRPLGWTHAERGDLAGRSQGGEVLQFVRNSGRYRAGQRVDAGTLGPGPVNPEHFAVYQPGEIALAKGDVVRITANGRDKSGKHKLNNGSLYPVAGFSPAGEIVLGNGWVLGKDFAHLAHGRVVTSHASQGATVDQVLIAMGHESEPAVTREQFYVSVSRARQKATVFTDLAPATLRAAIERAGDRRSATGLMAETARPPEAEAAGRWKAFAAASAETYRRLRMKLQEPIPEVVRERDAAYER